MIIITLARVRQDRFRSVYGSSLLVTPTNLLLLAGDAASKVCTSSATKLGKAGCGELTGGTFTNGVEGSSGHLLSLLKIGLATISSGSGVGLGLLGGIVGSVTSLLAQIGGGVAGLLTEVGGGVLDVLANARELVLGRTGLGGGLVTELLGCRLAVTCGWGQSM
jgi:hypothetical protein